MADGEKIIRILQKNNKCSKLSSLSAEFQGQKSQSRPCGAFILDMLLSPVRSMLYYYRPFASWSRSICPFSLSCSLASKSQDLTPSASSSRAPHAVHRCPRGEFGGLPPREYQTVQKQDDDTLWLFQSPELSIDTHLDLSTVDDHIQSEFEHTRCCQVKWLRIHE
ncbi:hypothetical protein H112_06722 [Trichophyton rubrum D6]|uniref:Uncharacterized protein n=3 Tax=Trichophyton TaxID=5550 RepID=A0A080WJE3_TRIRC|nr:uncharacterized protein TERG_11798 [Trichophyton rubrum CBS 118892]EZF12306.1 hypothetical protein H100_06738 [Trichophyton rubrum MR850]EZF39116.1 hypothetical protein H102_06705 [Trichophyton rubrum CBS 100081]EZF49760.1 hypothetical protein H103_06729 [Trichophyton rubrum CBS 288.86]EZF60412.1 hypothetical protein H104_06684 [Trichophyton rubrum CBS 289.86]EZF71121.1 hypothetical protein H105_06743 [Trichophyton soudanense CBS 452.61]EZF81691.1 hypothetical protein H110_06726 [Trichophy